MLRDGWRDPQIEHIRPRPGYLSGRTQQEQRNVPFARVQKLGPQLGPGLHLETTAATDFMHELRTHPDGLNASAARKETFMQLKSCTMI